MNSVKQSIYFLLTYSKIFLITLTLFVIFSIIILLSKSFTDLNSASLILQLFIFLGVFLGGSLVKLKNNYLWTNNTTYKNTILNSFFGIIVAINIFMAPLIFSLTSLGSIKVIVPFCLSVFAAQMVLAKNLIYKIIVPLIPIILFKLNVFSVSYNIIIGLIALTTALLVFSMYKNLFYKYTGNNYTKSKISDNTIAFSTTGLNKSQLDKLNGVFGSLIAKWVEMSNKTLDWAILMPHTRLAILAIFYASILCFSALISGPKIQQYIGFFILMIAPNLIVGIFMESSALLKQTTIFSHVFKGDNHRQLKNKIVMALDKNIAVNFLVYSTLVLIVMNALVSSPDILPLMLSLIVIIVLSLAINPLLLCFNYINISLALLVTIATYWVVLYQIIKLVYASPHLAIEPLFIFYFIVASLVLRIITQNIFWRKPLESLFRDY